MPIQLISTKPNDTIHVEIDFGNNDVHSVQFRHPKKAYSASITPDMKYQNQLGYINCKQINELPEGVTYGVEGDAPKAPVEMKEEHTPVLPPTAETERLETIPPALDTVNSPPEPTAPGDVKVEDQSEPAQKQQKQDAIKTSTIHSQSELRALDKSDLAGLAATMGIDPKGMNKDKMVSAIMNAEKEAVEKANG